MKFSTPRILVCSVDSFPKVGGISTLAYEVTQCLTENSDTCIYLGPRGLNFGNRPVAFKVYEDWESDVSLRAGIGSDLEDERIFDLMGRIIKAYKIDGLLGFHPFYYGPALVSAAKYHGIHSSIMVHGTELTSQFAELLDGIEIVERPPRSIAARLRTTLQRANTVISNSNFTSGLARKLAPSTSHRVVGCGLSDKITDYLIERTPEYISDQKRRRRQRLGFEPTRLIAYVGRLVPHKNLHELLDLGAASGFQIVIMGNGPLKNSLETYALEKGVHCTFIPNADDEKKWQVLQAADFGYLMSNFDVKTGGYEGFGISMLEYCAAGAVCLSDGSFGMADFSRDGQTTISPRDLEGHLDPQKLLEIANDEARMDAIIQAARELLKEEYTWPKVTEKILEAIV